LQRIFFAALAMVLLVIPVLGVAPVSALAFGLPPVYAQSQHKAVILSSLERLAPMGFYGRIISDDLKAAGYQVSFVNDSAVTIDFLLTQLNNYEIVIWRTNTYTYVHTTYWYVGAVVNGTTQEKYATDFAQGWIDGHAGTLGVDIDFFSHHYPSSSLNNVKLMLLMSSNSNAIGTALFGSGVKAIVVCNGDISLQFGTIDDLTGQLISNLTSGQDIYDAVYNTVSPYTNMEPRDPLDNIYTPPFWFLGDGSVTIT
jgi:hypothetical protein